MTDPRSATAGGVILGFRPHTYWTAVVALAGPRDAPRVLVRHKLVFASGPERSVYHQAAEVAGGEAEALIARVRVAVETNARAGVGALIDLLARDGQAPRLAAAPTGGRKLPALAEIVRVHTLQHAAEGEFYRDAVASACASLGLEVRRPVERELTALTADGLGVTPAELTARLKRMGETLGPPWGEDHRLATLAAWLQL
jgi:hypothetical protein